jgi:hypothetical protein|tara:strand:- start:1579 stop:2163 length:585 start_codon:yes stop_codon:yes gene_type:complete
MSFAKNKYQVIRQAIPKDLANFVMNYFLLQQDAVAYMLKNNIINKHNPLIGNWEDEQVPNAYAKYADWVMETLLQYVRPIMKQKTKLDLIPTYSYARIYNKGNILKKHKDRPSCEISTTLNLGGDHWSIYLEGIKVDLQQGDMLIYSGCELEHWREPFEGNFCVQVFLHYNHANGKFGQENLFDKRPILGIPKA